MSQKKGLQFTLTVPIGERPELPHAGQSPLMMLTHESWERYVRLHAESEDERIQLQLEREEYLETWAARRTVPSAWLPPEARAARGVEAHQAQEMEAVP